MNPITPGPVVVTVIATKADLARWTRAHADAPLNWTVTAGPGGTMLITEPAPASAGR